MKAKYASVCGSDMPYFKAKSLMAPSSYWVSEISTTRRAAKPCYVLNRVHLFAEPQDRDGFCGHEVVGVVVESKSENFKPGDEVMALPSSYFKAHTGKFKLEAIGNGCCI